MATRNAYIGHAGVRRCILHALSQPQAITDLAPAELDFTLRVMRRARLLAKLASRLRDANRLNMLEAPAYDALVGALTITEASVRHALWELNRVGRAIAADAPFAVIVLKGCAYCLSGLPNAPGRLFADVDLLVSEAALSTVEKQLVHGGWQLAALTPYDENYYRLWTHELPPMKHAEREVEIDLHHNLVMRTARRSPDPNLLLRDVRAVPGSRFSVLSPVDMTLHAIVHLINSEMEDGLRELVDIDELLRHFGAHEPGFWDRLMPRAAQLNLARPTFYALHLAHNILGTPVPPAVMAAARSAAPTGPIVWLMQRLAPRALFPQHPDDHSTLTSFARWLLFLRAHWLRMPPGLLVRHLSYKFYAKHLRRQTEGAA